MKIDITIDTNINKCDSDNVISKYMTEFDSSKKQQDLKRPTSGVLLFCTDISMARMGRSSDLQGNCCPCLSTLYGPFLFLTGQKWLYLTTGGHTMSVPAITTPESIQLKTCSKCGIEKSLSEFHKCKKSNDGHKSVCKYCVIPKSTLIKRSEIKRLFDAGMKKCTKCKKEKFLCEFGKSSNSSDGKKIYCKDCVHISNQRDKEKIRLRGIKYRHKNFDKIKKNKKDFYENNKEKILATQREYNKSHTYEKMITGKAYYKNNREILREKALNYLEKNRDIANKKRRDKWHQKSNSNILFDQLLITDNPRFDKEGFISVRCYYCHCQFNPTLGQIKNRINSVCGNVGGENNFYCCDDHKKTCPTFRFQTHKQIDPRSKLYIPKTITEKARAAQTDKLKKAQCLEHGYNYCERCGDIINVDLHHTLPVAKYGMGAIDDDSHILLCPGCHMALHRECV